MTTEQSGESDTQGYTKDTKNSGVRAALAGEPEKVAAAGVRFGKETSRR